MVYPDLLSELEKETAVGGKFFVFVFILYVVKTSDKDAVVREPPGVGGGTTSVILLLDIWKRLIFNGSLIFERWVEIQGRGIMVMVVLKVGRWGY